MAYKVYSTFSARRFHCDLMDAYANGYLSQSMPGLTAAIFMEDEAFTPILQDVIRQSALPLRAIETVFAPDSTGFSTSRLVRWYDEKYGTMRSGREWVKAHAICGVKTNIVTDVRILDKDANDCPQFKPLVETTAENFTVKEVAADKAYLSHENSGRMSKRRFGGTLPTSHSRVNSVPRRTWIALGEDVSLLPVPPR